MFKKVAILIASLATIHAHAANLHSSALRGQGDSGPTSPGKTHDFNDNSVPKTLTHAAVKEGYDANTEKHKAMASAYTPFIKAEEEQEETPAVLQLDLNTANMAHPNDTCGTCKKFFRNIIFPDLKKKIEPCQRDAIKELKVAGDTGNMVGYCSVWNSRMRGDASAGLRNFFTQMASNEGDCTFFIFSIFFFFLLPFSPSISRVTRDLNLTPFSSSTTSTFFSSIDQINFFRRGKSEMSERIIVRRLRQSWEMYRDAV